MSTAEELAVQFAQATEPELAKVVAAAEPVVKSDVTNELDKLKTLVETLLHKVVEHHQFLTGLANTLATAGIVDVTQHIPETPATPAA